MYEELVRDSEGGDDHGIRNGEGKGSQFGLEVVLEPLSTGGGGVPGSVMMAVGHPGAVPDTMGDPFVLTPGRSYRITLIPQVILKSGKDVLVLSEERKRCR